MPLGLTCRSCKETITGEDEDELVARVQAHALGHGRVHGVAHKVTRERVLFRLRRQQAKEERAREKRGGE